MSGDLLDLMTLPAKKQELLPATASYSSTGTIPLYGLDDGTGTFFRPVIIERANEIKTAARSEPKSRTSPLALPAPGQLDVAGVRPSIKGRADGP